jgi:hypothetical protein
MLPRLALTPPERGHAVELLLGYLDDDSSIERAFAMQALADLAIDDEALRRRIVTILEHLTATGTPGDAQPRAQAHRATATRLSEAVTRPIDEPARRGRQAYDA